MKRFISAILVGFLLLSTITFFAGCNNAEPTDENTISEQHRQYALRAIEISDAYFDGEMGISEAGEQMAELHTQKENLPEIEEGNPSHSYNAIIETAVVIMSTEFNIAINSATEPGDNVLYWRNNLAEMIGKDKR